MIHKYTHTYTHIHAQAQTNTHMHKHRTNTHIHTCIYVWANNKYHWGIGREYGIVAVKSGEVNLC